MKRFAIPAPDELHRQAKVKAAADGMSLTTVVCRLICGWLSGEIKLPECSESENATWSDMIGKVFVDHITDSDKFSGLEETKHG